MNFENASLNKYYQEINIDKTKEQNNINMKESQGEETKSRVKTLVDKIEKNIQKDETRKDNNEQIKGKENEKKLKKSYEEYLEKLNLLEEKESQLNLLRKEEIKMQSELKLIEDKFENTKKRISVKVDLDPNLTAELNKESIEKGKILLEKLEEVKRNKRIFDEMIDIQTSDKKHKDLEIIISKIVMENKELENKLNLIRESVDIKNNDEYNMYFIKDMKLQIEKMNEIKEGLIDKKYEYNEKLKINNREISYLKKAIEDLEENLYEEHSNFDSIFNNDMIFKNEMTKIQTYIELIKEEVDYFKSTDQLITKINRNEKIISNLIPDKKEEEAENEIILNRKDLIKSIDYSSKNSDLPLIESPFAEKNNYRITRDLNTSLFSETRIDRIFNIQLESFSYESTNHIEYSALCKDENYLRKVNKEILNRIEGSDQKYDKQFNSYIQSISNLKQNLNFLKKENDDFSSEIYELTNTLNRNKVKNINNPNQNRYSKDGSDKLLLESKNQKIGTVKRSNKRRESKNIKLVYLSREKFLKDVKYQRIKENKIF